MMQQHYLKRHIRYVRRGTKSFLSFSFSLRKMEDWSNIMVRQQAGSIPNSEQKLMPLQGKNPRLVMAGDLEP
jgi:hypothetical protein